jgi:hypothetical protein
MASGCRLDSLEDRHRLSILPEARGDEGWRRREDSGLPSTPKRLQIDDANRPPGLLADLLGDRRDDHGGAIGALTTRGQRP